MATKQRAAAKAVAQAEETLKRVHEHLDNANDEPAKRGPGRPPKAAASLEQVAQEVEAARHEHQRLSAQREQVTQSIRAIGHAYHFVDLERGVRRNGKLIAGDIQQHIDTIRTIAQQEGLSQTCLERIAMLSASSSRSLSSTSKTGNLRNIRPNLPSKRGPSGTVARPFESPRVLNP